MRKELIKMFFWIAEWTWTTLLQSSRLCLNSILELGVTSFKFKPWVQSYQLVELLKCSKLVELISGGSCLFKVLENVCYRTCSSIEGCERMHYEMKTHFFQLFWSVQWCNPTFKHVADPVSFRLLPNFLELFIISWSLHKAGICSSLRRVGWD